MQASNLNLAMAFPRALRAEALAAITALPEVQLTAQDFFVNVGSDIVSVPYRIYHDPDLVQANGLTKRQSELVACLLTRHHSGFVREANLKKILGCPHEWICPFVLQLVGEYVVEIVSVIRDNLELLDLNLYRAFLNANPDFHRTIRQRAESYWNCYYRDQPKNDYAGFQVLEAFGHA